jgi:hypothetical protein
LRSLFTILLFALSAGPALAGPREETLAGISRCAGLPDDRTFLDCIYGAAQPMRAALGLSPALPAQQRLVPPASPGPARAVLPPQAGVQNAASNAGDGGWLETTIPGKSRLDVRGENGPYLVVRVR